MEDSTNLSDVVSPTHLVSSTQLVLRNTLAVTENVTSNTQLDRSVFGGIEWTPTQFPTDGGEEETFKISPPVNASNILVFEEAIKVLLNYHGLEGKVSVEEYGNISEAKLHELLPKAKLLPGATKLVEYFHKHSIPMAICTGSASPDFKLKVQEHKKLIDLIPLRVLTGDDPEVKRGKPAPDGFLVTMGRFSSPPVSASNILVFEDAANGISSALAAGMRVCAVPTLGVPFPDGVLKRADVVLKTLEEFDPVKFGLPAGL